MSIREKIKFLIAMGKVFALVRSEIRAVYCIYLLNLTRSEIPKVIDETFSFNSYKDEIKNLLSELMNDSKKSKDYLKYIADISFNRNINYDNVNLENIYGYLILIEGAINEICTQLELKNIDRAYDAVDAIHGFPGAVINEKGWDSGAFIRTYFKPYRKKWNKYYLIEMERLIK